MPWRDTIVLLGIPLDNLTTAEAADRIVALAELYRQDGRPRHVATVNVDFLVNTLAWRPDRARHPELLRILRQADLVTADGMPLVWLSRLLGTPLKERVAGSGLVPLLARLSAERNLSLYLLGGQGDVAERAAETLRRQIPGVRIAGIDAPFVRTQGPELADESEHDLPLLERIRAADPDILLIGFGNPKQEIWFDRNRGRLRAGVAIGIGGTFEFIAGRVARAPAWMQRTGLEWIFRLLQEPRRLFRRYLVGLFKFGYLALPSIVHFLVARARLRRRRGPCAQPGPAVAGSTGVPLRLPAAVDAAFVAQLDPAARERLLEQPYLGLDFSAVGFLDSAGLGFVLTLLRHAREAGKSVAIAGMTARARKTFETTRTWDLVAPHLVDALPAGPVGPAPAFAWSVTIEGTCAILSLAGELDAREAGRLSAESVLAAAGPRPLLADLSRLTFCDSSGLALLLRLQRAQASQGRAFVLCQPGPDVRQMLRITRLDRLIPTAGSLAEGRAGGPPSTPAAADAGPGPRSPAPRTPPPGTA